MKKYNIKFLVMDVDGTLTDGKIYMGDRGEVFKIFDVKDGYGICEILPKHNIIPVIITARKSNILINRCTELGIKELYQGERKKLVRLKSILQIWSSKDDKEYTLRNVAYIGDDLLDISCMSLIKEQGGAVGCPIDAVKQVKAISSFVSSRTGGSGAVREFIEWLLE